MGELLSLLLFLLAANLDTVLLAMSWGLRQRRFSRRAALVIASVTTAATWLALALGRWAAGWLTEGFAQRVGGGVLLAMGVWVLADGLREQEAETPMPASLGECGMVALALGANNMGMGVGAGLAGLTPGLAALCNLLITVAALGLGSWLGRRAAGSWFSRWAPLASGVLLIVLGAVELGT